MKKQAAHPLFLVLSIIAVLSMVLLFSGCRYDPTGGMGLSFLQSTGLTATGENHETSLTAEGTPAAEGTEETSQEAISEASKENEVPQKSATPIPGTSRNHPAPAGPEIVVGDMKFAVEEISRPANKEIAAASRENTVLPKEREYVLVTLEITCVAEEDEVCSFEADSISLVGEQGIISEAELSIVGLENMLENKRFFGGAVLQGVLPFAVDGEEENLVMIYEQKNETLSFLALPEIEESP